MGLLDGTTQYEYYTGNDQGNYQFTSLEDIINQFLVAYVGEEKIISKASRTDVAFHAQRAMQELSFDTFKSIKSQEIVLPPSNTMMLPHDYVNYTRVMWSDSAGIKHPLYPTRDTQNPFAIKQEDNGDYYFQGGSLELSLNNPDFEDGLTGWVFPGIPGAPVVDDLSAPDALTFRHGSKNLNNQGVTARAYAVTQQLDVEGIDSLDLEAVGNAAASSTSSPEKGAGKIRLGIVSSLTIGGWDPTLTSPNAGTVTSSGVYTPNPASQNYTTNMFNLPTTSGNPSCITWGKIAAEEGTDTTISTQDTGECGTIDVSAYDVVYIVITSWVTDFSTLVNTDTTQASVNTIDDIKIDYEGINPNLTSEESTTWSNYKSNTPSENQDSYDDDYYVNALGQRYGLNPQHAQVNGSFYIDNLRGLINFSSNVSGKTVILDYISDSLGTDGEMQVHKFAEEAMYKWIMYAILSTRANTPEYIVKRYQKEKFAATRQAKLRLSNIKLEEITQTFRGKSKHIKH